MRVSIAAVGSRGDIQPYLALSLGLQQAGFEIQFCADRLFEQLVKSTGLPFAPVTAAPVNLMQQNLSRLGGPIKLIGWLNHHFKPLAREFFSDLDLATSRADAILYSTLAFAGYHVAEKHGIPALGVYNVPITPTCAFHNPSFPVAPAWFPFKRSYNWWSFRIANQLFINMIKPIVNECRREVLGIRPLPNRFFSRLDISPIPIVYGFSPNLIPPPPDWGECRKISGHWFLEDHGGWQPSVELIRFLEAGSPPIYVGFGSMVDQQIRRATPIILGALERLGLRGVLMGGWGGLGAGELPATIMRIESTPHDWLFPRVVAVVHHGGAGTTATGLRHGKPTVVVPFFADQPFWGGRVYALGCGPHPIPFSKMDINKLAVAIDQAIHDRRFGQNAQAISEKLKTEDGVGKAVGYIRIFLENKSFCPEKLN